MLFFHRQFYGLLWFWAEAFNAVFAKAFQSLPCENVRTILGNVEGCGIQHLLFCFSTTDWKYDFCRYQFVVNTFFMRFTSILYLFLLYLRFTHIQYVLFQTYHIVILHTPTYKPSHTSNITTVIFWFFLIRGGIYKIGGAILLAAYLLYQIIIIQESLSN